MTEIVCLGDAMRGDDAAGLAVAEELQRRGIPARVAAVADLLDGWGPDERVLLVDTVRSDAAPGTVHRIDARRAPLPERFATGSTHLLGLAEAIELARELGRLPATLDLIGIEGERFELGAELSPAVRGAVELVAAELASTTSRA